MKKTLILPFITAFALFGAQINFTDASDKYARINPAISGESVLSYHDSIATAKKSVVNISTSRIVKTNNQINPFNDPIFQEFFGFQFKMPKESQKSTSLGSGVIVSSDGYIVTNYHVVEDSDEIIVTLLDSSKEYKAKIVGTDSKTDIAIIKVNAKDFKAIKFADSSKILEGDVVFAIGNPFGVGGSISHGIISGLNKDNIGLNQYEDFIQTDASINPGNSGGALVDSRGALVGINSAILSRSGGNNGIGFAIPSNMVKQIAQKLIKDGKITRGYIGVSISNLTSDQKEIYSNKQGALIANVEKDGPAERAGLQRGDLIIKVDDKIIKNANDLKNFIGSLDPNREITIEFERSNELSSIKLRLANMDGAISGESLELSGLKIQNLNDAARSKFGISKEVKGVIIGDIKSGSNAEFAGFEIGDVIVQVNQKAILSVADLRSEIQKSKKQQKKPMIWIDRRGMIMGLVLKLD